MALSVQYQMTDVNVIIMVLYLFINYKLVLLCIVVVWPA